MGSVYLARPVSFDDRWPPLMVVKTLHPELAAKDNVVARFRHEAATAVRIDSPHVARVYGAGAVDGVLYIAMEHVEGRSLQQLMHRLREAGRPLSVELAVDVIIGVLDGVTALHEAIDPLTDQPLGIVHRDIKPANIMVSPGGEPRLIDLGLGKSSMKSWRTQTGQLLGTPGYMPPEQIEGLAVDGRSDVFACAVVLFELLTQTAYVPRGPVAQMVAHSLVSQFRPPSTVRGPAIAKLDPVLERALAVEPDDRWPTAAAFRAALVDALPDVAEETMVGGVPLEFEEVWAVTTAPGVSEAMADESGGSGKFDRSVVFATAPGLQPFGTADLVAPTDPWRADSDADADAEGITEAFGPGAMESDAESSRAAPVDAVSEASGPPLVKPVVEDSGPAFAEAPGQPVGKPIAPVPLRRRRARHVSQQTRRKSSVVVSQPRPARQAMRALVMVTALIACGLAGAALDRAWVRAGRSPSVTTEPMFTGPRGVADSNRRLAPEHAGLVDEPGDRTQPAPTKARRAGAASDGVRKRRRRPSVARRAEARPPQSAAELDDAALDAAAFDETELDGAELDAPAAAVALEPLPSRRRVTVEVAVLLTRIRELARVTPSPKVAAELSRMERRLLDVGSDPRRVSQTVSDAETLLARLEARQRRLQ